MRVGIPRAHPFALMMAPRQVLEAMEKSDALRRLQHQVFHALEDRVTWQTDAALAAFNAAIDRTSLVLPPEGAERS